MLKILGSREYKINYKHIELKEWKHPTIKGLNYIPFNEKVLKKSLKKIVWTFNDPSKIDNFDITKDIKSLNLLRVVLLAHHAFFDDETIYGKFCYIEFLDSEQQQLIPGKSSMLFGIDKGEKLNEKLIIDELLNFLKTPVDWSDKGDWEGRSIKRHRLVHHKSQDNDTNVFLKIGSHKKYNIFA